MGGLYELHISVEKKDVNGFEIFCKDHQAKVILIELPGAIVNEHLMCGKWVSGTLEKAHEVAAQFRDDAEQHGFKPIRTKIELVFSKAPEDHILDKAKGQYWEFHYKVKLQDLQAEEELMKKIQGHQDWRESVRIARSSLRDTAPDGGIYRIVTLRDYDASKAVARQLCEGFQQWLKDEQYELIKVQKDFSVYDDNLALEDGW